MRIQHSLPIIFSLLFTLLSFSPDKAIGNSAPTESLTRPAIYLKNNSLLPRKITIITYSPLRTGNSTEMVTLLPGQRIKRKYALNTKVYIATPEQVNTVMGGGRISKDEPFVKVTLGNVRKVYKLF